MASAKKTYPKTKGRRDKTTAAKRFPGLFSSILLLLAIGLPLAILYLLPLPANRKAGTHPPFENFRHAPKQPYPRPEGRPPGPPAAFKAPMVAIIIDDMGYDNRLDRRFISLEAPLSFSFLPYAPYTRRLAALAGRLHRDVLIHIPMEPLNKRLDPGPGVITLDMDFDRRIETLRKDIDAVPCAVGANNHMGSKFTTDRKAMEIVLTYLKGRGLFFIDSRTTRDTVAFDVARHLGIPCGQRAVFLDHSLLKQDIEHEIDRLLRLAKSRGRVIAIGHPNRVTYQVLYDRLPVIRKRARLVPVHRLVY